MLNVPAKLKLGVLKNMPYFLFVFIFVVFGVLSPRFFSYANFENIIASASYKGILTVGMTLVLLTGGIDLSVGANMFLSASVAGLLIQDYNVPVWMALAAAVVIGTLFGMFNAFFIVRLKILPFLVTISTMIAGRGLTLLLTKSVGTNFPDSVTSLGAARFLGIPLQIIICIIIIALAHLFLRHMPLGRQVYAVGNDPESAKKAGIDSDRVKAMVYILSGLLAGIAGVVCVSQLGIVNAGFGKNYEFDAVASAVLGGTSLFGGIGTVFPGAIIGTVLIQMVQAGLVFLQVDLYVQPIISAGVIFLAVLLDSMRNRQILKLEKRNIRVE